jgi:hypothetical protein
LPLLSTFIIPLCLCFPHLLSHFDPVFHIYYQTLTLFSKFIITLCPCFPHLLSHLASAFRIYYPTLTLFSKFIIALCPCFPHLLSHFAPDFRIYYPVWLKFGMKQLPIMLLSIFEFRQNRCSELMKKTVCSLLIQTAPCAPTRAGTSPFLTRFS